MTLRDAWVVQLVKHLSDSWFQVRSWSPGHEIKPCVGLCVGRGAWLRFSLSLCPSSPSCSLSLKQNKQTKNSSILCAVLWGLWGLFSTFQHNLLVSRNVGSGARSLEFKSHFCHRLAKWLVTTPLSYSFIKYKPSFNSL